MDIGWVDGHAALVRDDAQYERWDVVRQRRLVRVEGKGARQLLGAYVNVVDDYDASCTLMRISTEGLTPAKHFDRAYSFSVDADGWMLARDVGRTDEARRDLLLTPLLEEVWSGALGHYDCFNYYVRVDGAVCRHESIGRRRDGDGASRALRHGPVVSTVPRSGSFGVRVRDGAISDRPCWATAGESWTT